MNEMLQGSHHEVVWLQSLWLCLGNKNMLFKVRETLWVWLYINKHFVFQFTMDYFSIRLDLNVSKNLSAVTA